MKRSFVCSIISLVLILFIPFSASANSKEDDIAEVVEVLEDIFDAENIWYEFQHNDSGVVMRATIDGLASYVRLATRGIEIDGITYDIWIKQRYDAIKTGITLQEFFEYFGVKVEHVLYLVVNEEDNSDIMFAVYNGELIFDKMPHEIE